jgi:hypothetical protein
VCVAAAAKLLRSVDFEPSTDQAFIDARFGPALFKSYIAELFDRMSGHTCSFSSIHCSTGADLVLPVVRNADDTAYRLRDKYHDDLAPENYFKRRVEVTPEDLALCGQLLQAEDHRSHKQHYVNNQPIRHGRHRQ